MSDYPRPAWAVGAQLEAIKSMKLLYRGYMSEDRYKKLVEDLTKEYAEAQKIAEDYYP